MDDDGVILGTSSEGSDPFVQKEPKKKERCWRCNGSGKELHNGLFGLEAWTCSRCWGTGEEK